MVRYDASQVQRFAQIMYRQAFITVAVWTFLGLLVGLAVSAFAVLNNWELQRVARNVGGPPVLIGIGTAVIGAIGFAIGQAKAFWYRLVAQILLCQSQIEANTRQRIEFPEIR